MDPEALRERKFWLNMDLASALYWAKGIKPHPSVDAAEIAKRKKEEKLKKWTPPKDLCTTFSENGAEKQDSDLREPSE